MKGFFLIFLIIFPSELSSKYSEAYYDTNVDFKERHSNETISTLPIKCQTDEECQTFILDSKCISNNCECTNDKVLSSDASKCLSEAKEYGSPCEDNAQCSKILSAGGICKNSQCMCKIGYHYLKGLCWKTTDLNEKCFRNEQCFSAYEYVGLMCENNTCKCRKNYYKRLSSGCRRVRKTNESCNLDDDCTDGSTCEKMVCRKSGMAQKTTTSLPNTIIKRRVRNFSCSKGFFQINDMCVRELGMKCEANSECEHIPNALCLDGSICGCKPAKYVASENNKECLRVTIGKVEDIKRSTCKRNSQCGVFGGGSFCLNGRCACKEGTYFENDTKFCWKIKTLEESCFDNRDCYPQGTHAECKNTETGKFCACKKGYHQRGSNCLFDASKVGDPCLSDNDCLFPNSFCNETKICTCKESHYVDNGKCIPSIGSFCSTDANCSHLNNTECKAKGVSIKRCLCLENYTNSEDYKYCLQVRNFKEKCEESFQCKFPRGDQGMCENSVCECCKGEHYLNGKCYKSKFIKEPCSSRSECFAGNDNNSAICLKGFCSCNYDYELDESNFCVKKNSVNTMKHNWILLLSVALFFHI